MLALYGVLAVAEAGRWSLLSQYFNKKSFSYNRATTLSLTNVVKNILNIPLIFVAAFLVEQDLIYPYVFVGFVCLLATLLLRFDRKEEYAVSNI